MTKRATTYLVAGSHTVFGHQPGEQLDVSRYPAEQVARLVARGSLEPIHEAAAPAVVEPKHEAAPDVGSGKEQD